MLKSSKIIGLKTSVLLMLFFLISVTCYSQDYNYKNYTLEDGLPSEDVYGIFQDSKGYMWFATERGVAKFNGKEFRVFNTKNGLEDNINFSFFEDNLQRIWIFSFTNKFCYIKNDRVYNSDTDPLLKKLNQYRLSSIFDFWLHGSQFNNTIYFSSRDRDLLKVTTNRNVQKIKFQKITEDKSFLVYHYNHHTYGLTSNGITDIETQKDITKFKLKQEIKTVNTVYKNKPYFFNDKTLYQVNGTTIQVKYIYNDSLNITSIHFANDTTLWLGTSVGLWNINLNTGKKTELQFFKEKHITKIIADLEQNIWVSTIGNGIYLINDLNISKVNRFSSPIEKISALSSYQNKIYAGTQNGNVSRLYLKQNILNIETIALPIEKNTQSKLIKDFVFNKDTVWIALNYKIIKKHLTKPIQSEQDVIATKSINRLSNNQIWVTYNGGIINERELFSGFKLNSSYISSRVSGIRLGKNCYSMFYDSVKQLYLLGHNNGLSFFNEDVTKTIPINGRITKIMSKNNNCFWLLNTNEGIVLFEHEQFYVLKIKNTNNEEVIANDFYLENDSTAWIAYNKGFSKIIINLKTKTISKQIPYIIYDGLTQPDVIKIMKNNNELWLGTSNGLYYTSIPNLKNVFYNVPIYITSITVNREDKTLKDTIYLKYNENNIAVNFTGLYFKKFSKIKYRYKLNRSGNDWKITQANLLEFPDMQPGKHVLSIQACDAFGHWNQHSAKIIFIISPPFYSTTLFIIVVSLLIIAIVFFILNKLTRINNKKRTKELQTKTELISSKEKIVELRQKQIEAEQKMFMAQVNPHFIFNSLNSIQNFVLKSKPEEAYTYIAKFSKLIRSILINSKTDLVSIKEDLENLETYLELEKLRFSNKLNYTIIGTEEIPLNHKIPAMLLQPFIENAIWHGLMPKKTEGSVNIVYTADEEYLYVSIQDNGIGRVKAATYPKQKQGTGSGLTLCEERLRLYSEKIHKLYNITIEDLYHNNNATGTLVTLKIPTTE